jgi:hypothetical protein
MQCRYTVWASLTLLAAGCGGLESSVRTRAASDFHCDQSQLKILDQEQTVFRVAGCGSEATYVCSEGLSLRVHCKRADWEAQGAADERSQL